MAIAPARPTAQPGGAWLPRISDSGKPVLPEQAWQCTGDRIVAITVKPKMWKKLTDAKSELSTVSLQQSKAAFFNVSETA